MIGGEHAVQVACPPDRLWAFMEHFPNWAAYVVGYQSLRVVDDTTSVWTLRGDVGILSREVEIEVAVTSWEPGRSAAFSLEGVTERLSGTGSFEISADEPGATVTAPAVASTGPSPATATASRVPPADGWWARLRRRFGRWMIRRARRSGQKGAVAAPVGKHVADAAPPAQTAGGAWLRFRLEVTPGGPMAPMLEMLMAPLLEPAAEDLSLRIREDIEGRAA